MALEAFLSHVPPDAGIALVIVQHLDPHRNGMLVDLLQRHTAMPVAQIHDQMPIELDHVYVIPPGRDLSVLNGVLHLLEPVASGGPHLPIDFFFKSLAQDCKQNGVGVILSGMGSDGTQGLRAIKQAAGACFVQTPASAQFDGMPRSASMPVSPTCWRRRRSCRCASWPTCGARSCGPSPTRLIRSVRSRPGFWRRPSSCCRRSPATTFRSTRKARCCGASSGAWACIN